MTEKVDLIGKWSQQKIKLKEKFTFLTEADLEYEKGREEEMMEKLQAVLGKSKADLRKIIDEL